MSADSASPDNRPAPRHHGLDWLRAAAALLVVALHAGIAYTTHPFPGLAWPVHDRRPSPVVDAITWWIDAWIMPAFFVIGGFVAAGLFERLGPAGFLKHRARRLLAPLLFGCIVVLPLDLYVWLLGWVVEERIPLNKLRSLKLGEAGRDLWGVGHLWFLQYLFLFCLAAWALHFLAATGRGRARQRSRIRIGLATTLIASISALALWWDPQLLIGFRHSWHPLPANLIYFGTFYFAGWAIYARRPAGNPRMRFGVGCLALSAVAFAVALPLIHRQTFDELAGIERIGLVASFAGCGWMTALGLFWLALRHCGEPPVAVRYLSQASLTIYLFHHPAVGLAQVALAGSGLPAGLKYILAWGAATALSLLTYEACVRRTWVGELLHGRRDATAQHRPARCGAVRRMRRAA